MPDEPVALADLLAARERRVALRDAALAAHPGTAALSVTPVMPGPVKDSRVARLLQAAALAELGALLDARAWPWSLARAETGPTGAEALLLVEAEAADLKRAVADLEDRHPLGRLWDIDVAAAAGRTLARRDLGLPPRACLLCAEPAHACARSRAHAVPELLAAIHARALAWVLSDRGWPSAPEAR